MLPYYNRKTYLEATLVSYLKFYKNSDIEVIVVDDCSAEEHRVESLTDKFKDINLNVIRIPTKTGINPCYPYNVGVRAAQGEVLILSSPETVHTESIVELSENFKDLDKESYFCFSVFCPTSSELNRMILATTVVGDDMLLKIRDMLWDNAHAGLGENGRPAFNNVFGSWYLHSQFKPSALNFLTAMRRDLFVEMSGFNEAFRNGTGFDDTEFKDRLMQKVKTIKYFDKAFALHLNHPPVYGAGNPVSNMALYNDLENNPYRPNDNWGKL